MSEYDRNLFELGRALAVAFCLRLIYMFPFCNTTEPVFELKCLYYNSPWAFREEGEMHLWLCRKRRAKSLTKRGALSGEGIASNFTCPC